VRWAKIRPRAQAAAGRRHARWQDVLVIGAPTPDPQAEAAAVQAVSSVLPRGTFPHLLIVGRQAAMAHPFIEAVVAVARPLLVPPGVPASGEASEPGESREEA
jgi:hypothetical protein